MQEKLNRETRLRIIPAHQIYPLSHRDGGYIFMCRGEMMTAAVVRSKSCAERLTREAFTVIEMRAEKLCSSPRDWR